MIHWLEQETKRANRNLLLVNLAVLLALFGSLYADWRYYANFVTGCKAIRNEELASLTTPSQRFRDFVTVRGTRSVDTGYQDIVKHVENSTGRVLSTEVKDQYMILRAGDRLLLVKAADNAPRLEYSGELVPTTDAVQRDLVAPLKTSDPELANMVLPFTLDTTDFRTQGYWALAIGVPLFLLSCWNLSKAARRSAEPQLAPIARQLAVYGDPAQLSLQIGAELLAPHNRYKGMRFTQSWLVEKRAFSTWLSPLDDIVWAYKKVTRHSVNFIPTGKTYAAIVVGRHRQRIEKKLSKKAVDTFLTELAARVPWAVYGFDGDLENAWKKDPAGFVAAVDARKTQLTAQPATASS